MNGLIMLARPESGLVEEALAQRWTRRVESQANEKDMHALGGAWRTRVMG